MRRPRIFLDYPIQTGAICTLSDEASRHVAQVLRMRVDEQLVLFNGQGGEFIAEIIIADKRRIDVKVGQHILDDRESNCDITLVQGISRGQKMDYILQKAVELGVKRIVPIMTEHGTVHLDSHRAKKRHLHWYKIIISACEQCGRNTLPELMDINDFGSWIIQDKNEIKLIFSPETKNRLSELEKTIGQLTLLIGPEGGFSQHEYALAQENGYQALGLGPRILRTETAAVAAITVCQNLWGDMY